MKKWFCLLSLVCLSAPMLWACDFCNAVSGINPYYNAKNRIAVNFLSQRAFLGARPSLKATAGASKQNPTPQLMHGGHSAFESDLRETRQTIELNAQYHLHERIMLTALIPFAALSLNQRSTMSVSGLGDASLLAHFIAPDSWLESLRLLSTNLLIGFGVKFPTGLSNLNDSKGNRLDTRFQSGSGSWDFMLNALFTMQRGKMTYTLDALGKRNTANSIGDRLGDSFSLTAALAREVARWNESETAIIGIIGARVETKSQDWIAGRLDSESDFTACYAQIGGQLVFRFIRFDVLALAPLYQARHQFAPNEQMRFLTSARVEF